MSIPNGANDAGQGWDGHEPLFRDVPLEQTDWAGLYEVLKQVNQPKAELVRAQYEVVRVAYQNYIKARKEEINTYAQQRRDDEMYNREVYEQRRQIAENIKEIHLRWQPKIDHLLEEHNHAFREAYRRAALAGINLRGDPILGIGLAEENDGNTNAQGDSISTSKTDTPPDKNDGNTNAQGDSISTSKTDTPPDKNATFGSSKSNEPITPEETAQDDHLSTDQSLVLPHWLHWVAPLLIGLAIGQILLVGIGHPREDWKSLSFWVASLAGMLSMLLWYRGVWGMSSAISDLYHLFDWGAVKARHTAQLGGLLLTLFAILPPALIVLTLYWFPTTGTHDSRLLPVFALLLMMTLLGVGLVSGYLQGRAQVVSDTVQSESEKHGSQQQVQQEQPRPVERQPTEQGNTEPSIDSEPTPPTTPPPTANSTDRLLREAFEAIGDARGAFHNFRRSREVMQQELAPYEQMLRDLQPRPIYNNLPPWAKQQIQTLYNQWRDAFCAFLDCVAESARECKDGQHIEQCIADFKHKLMV